MDAVVKLDRTVIELNLLLLLFVAVIPWATGLLALNLRRRVNRASVSGCEHSDGGRRAPHHIGEVDCLGRRRWRGKAQRMEIRLSPPAATFGKPLGRVVPVEQTRVIVS
jgi:hypothetical protein